MKEEEGFEESDDPDDEKNKEDDDDDMEGNPITQGHSIVACDQSAITGESLAVDKYMGEVAYYTTGCKRGKAYGIVLTSAKYSFVGRTATLVQGAKDQGHFKAIMNSIGTALLVLVMFFILAAWIGGFFRHLKISTPTDDSNNLLHYALILLIVGVPVGYVSLLLFSNTTIAYTFAVFPSSLPLLWLSVLRTSPSRRPLCKSLLLSSPWLVLTSFALTRPEL